LSVYSDLVLTV